MRKFTLIMAIALLFLAPVAIAQTSVDETKAAKSDGTVEINNVAGSVRVIGWDKPEIHVSGTLEKNVEKLEFEVRDGRSLIKVKIPHHGGHHAGADLTIEVPQSSILEVETVSASVTVENTASLNLEQGTAERAQIKTVSGKVQLKTAANNISVESVSGDLQLEMKAKEATIKTVSGEVRFSGTADNLHVESVSGDLTHTGAIGGLTANTISGDITANGIQREAAVSSVSGDINLTAAQIVKAEMSSMSGSIGLNGALAEVGRINASSQSGNMNIGFTNDVSATFELNSMSGNIKTSLNVAEAAEAKSMLPGKKMNFATGMGTGLVRCESISGNITILKKN